MLDVNWVMFNIGDDPRKCSGRNYVIVKLIIDYLRFSTTFNIIRNICHSVLSSEIAAIRILN
jgi:hypothetical protein